MRRFILWSSALSRLTSLMSALCLAWALSGCSGCQAQDGPCPESPCSSLERCVQGRCVSITDVLCIPSCGAGQICEQGRCIEGVQTCTAQGQVCDAFRPISGDFYCVDWDGLGAGQPPTCSSPCSPTGQCSPGEACYILTGLNDSPCADQSGCGLGRICLNGLCRAAACQPSECEGALQGLETCARLRAGAPGFPSGATCLERADGTNQCVPAGLQSVAQPCISPERAEQLGTYDFTCRVGLACVQGICQRACDDSRPCPDEQTSCLFAAEDVVGRGVGLCGQPCEPFTWGQCGQGRQCLPVRAELGYCVPAGELPAFAACLPGSFTCQEGLTCVSYATGQGRCMPMCNLTVAPPQGSTTLTLDDQRLRDATCPQPNIPVEAFVSVAHMARGAGAVDLYLDGAQTPWIAGLRFEQRAQAQDSPGEFLTISPGARTLSVLPAGASPIEPPLAEVTLSLRRDEAYLITLMATPAQVASRVSVGLLSLERVGASAGAQVIHALPDAGPLDVRATPATDPSAAALTLASSLDPRGLSRPVALPAGAYLVQAWRAGLLADSPQAPPLLQGVVELTDAPRQELYLRGTLDPDDAEEPAGVSLLTSAPLPEPNLGPPPLTCQGLDNGVFGFCEQVCQDPQAYVRGVCEGPQMSCTPIRRPGFLGWTSVCRPAGQAAQGQPCDPSRDWGACGPNLYCLEFGNAAVDYSPSSPRGRCLPLCDLSPSQGSGLLCSPDQSCQALDASFQVGRCGYACEPDPSYSDDASCPAGLGGCKPLASATTSPEGTPRVQPLPTFCSASGFLGVGQPCSGADCVPGSECLFPRSAQRDLVSTLLSAYFGAPGQTPTCRPLCDPFDGDRAATRCGPQETCLVNFPWSAEVGHCAPIVEQIQPFQTCSRPGESCGQDSVCVIDGGQPFCLRLCQYEGGPAPNVYSRSTCEVGYQCFPLIDDVGFCRAP